MKKFFAYLKDGTQVGFTHPVDRNQAIARGMSLNPPGVAVVEKPAPPAGEMAEGISTIASASVATPAAAAPAAAEESVKTGKAKAAKTKAATQATSTKIAR